MSIGRRTQRRPRLLIQVTQQRTRNIRIQRIEHGATVRHVLAQERLVHCIANIVVCTNVSQAADFGICVALVEQPLRGGDERTCERDAFQVAQTGTVHDEQIEASCEIGCVDIANHVGFGKAKIGAEEHSGPEGVVLDDEDGVRCASRSSKGRCELGRGRSGLDDGGFFMIVLFALDECGVSEAVN